ncbi:MAG: serine hydrolase, partial [Acidobacteriaceae bacterium]|nr:serine hydrolase [Acidobacteriaceae bacterium]
DFPDYRESEAASTTPEKLVERFRNKPLDFEPGSKWKYSNSGYVLLGYLIEKVSGETYQRFLQENIFTPLGMKDSGYDSNSEIIRHRAAGYSPGNGGIINAGFINMTVPFSAGGLYSTTEDLLRWERGLFGGKVLSAASLQKMTTPFKDNYACGLFVETSNGHKQISHGGGIEGFNTSLAYWPDEKLSIIVLGNLNGGAPGDISNKLGAVMHGEQVTLPSERKEITVSPDVLQTYVGTYELVPGVDMTITLEGSQLMTQLTGQPKFPLYAQSKTLFFLKVVDAQVEFSKDASGKVTQATLHQNGRDTVARKK